MGSQKFRQQQYALDLAGKRWRLVHASGARSHGSVMGVSPLLTHLEGANCRIAWMPRIGTEQLSEDVNKSSGESRFHSAKPGAYGETMSIMFADGASAPSAHLMDGHGFAL